MLTQYSINTNMAKYDEVLTDHVTAWCRIEYSRRDGWNLDVRYEHWKEELYWQFAVLTASSLSPMCYSDETVSTAKRQYSSPFQCSYRSTSRFQPSRQLYSIRHHAVTWSVNTSSYSFTHPKTSPPVDLAWAKHHWRYFADVHIESHKFPVFLFLRANWSKITSQKDLIKDERSVY